MSVGTAWFILDFARKLLLDSLWHSLMQFWVKSTSHARSAEYGGSYFDHVKKWSWAEISRMIRCGEDLHNGVCMKIFLRVSHGKIIWKWGFNTQVEACQAASWSDSLGHSRLCFFVCLIVRWDGWMVLKSCMTDTCACLTAPVRESMCFVPLR